VATVELEGSLETVHVKNTGRCKELLLPDARVFLSESLESKRKTRFDLVSVIKEREGKSPLFINMDSSAPNDAVAEWLPHSGLFERDAEIKREVTYGRSRFDFLITEKDRETYLEVKGVTLEKNGILRFPDAPTERGVKHLNELSHLAKGGGCAMILFVIQMKGAECFMPNSITHKEFKEALSNAKSSGVRILAYDCIVTENEMTIDAPVDVIID
jgi:sugar fermentation stimulation protein A